DPVFLFNQNKRNQTEANHSLISQRQARRKPISSRCNDRIRAMPRDFFDPTPEEQQVVPIDAETLRKAERLIESCEHCNPEGAEIPFDNILASCVRTSST